MLISLPVQPLSRRQFGGVVLGETMLLANGPGLVVLTLVGLKPDSYVVLGQVAALLVFSERNGRVVSQSLRMPRQRMRSQNGTDPHNG